MGDELKGRRVSEPVATSIWTATCKDCQAEESKKHGGKPHEGSSLTPTRFQYSDDWTLRLLQRGSSRSDRCERHRREHRAAIQALSVAYIDLETIGAVSDPSNPTGPLGGLGPLPTAHSLGGDDVELDSFKMGMDDDDIRQLLCGLVDKRIAVVEAGTGTGKSTLMPFRLMNPPPGAALRLNDFGPIVVTEPRKAAATGVARFVGEAMCFNHDPKLCCDHIGPGFPVGYQVSGDRKWDSACQLIYVTDGTMINWVSEGRLAGMSAVIVDEAHERSENIDIILAQLRDQLPRHKRLRVIVTSATMNKVFFEEFFGGPSKVHYQFIPPKKSFGYGVPLFIGTDIDEVMIAEGLSVKDMEGKPVVQFEGWASSEQIFGDEVPPRTESDHEDLRATTLLLRELRRKTAIPMEKDNWQKEMPLAVAEQVVRVALGTTFGDILAFLPTEATIKEAADKIESDLQSKGCEFDVYSLLANTPPLLRDKAIEARQRTDKRKIIVSSNLAETSLTVKGVRYVVDSGLICQPEWDPSTASGCYPTKYHSQSGVRQRWGRVGRDAPGWVFPLYTLNQFLELPRTTPPGATQANLETFYMKLMAAGLDPEKVILPASFEHPSVTLDEASRADIGRFNQESERAKNALKLSGAVDIMGHLTEFGRELVRFRGTGVEAMAMMLADQLSCAHEVALALSVLTKGRLIGSGNEIFRVSRDWPNAWRVHAANCHRALSVGCEDDLHLLVKTFAEWQKSKDRVAWCASWWLNNDALEEAESSISDLILPLSGHMKSCAERAVRPDLVDRARAVISKAMGGLRYRRSEDGVFNHVTSAYAVRLESNPKRLIEPTDEIIVLSSYRPPRDRRTGEARSPVITAFIRAPESIDFAAGGGDGMGFELVVEVAERSRKMGCSLVGPQDVLSTVRSDLPVGGVFDIRVGSDQLDGLMKVEEFVRVAAPFSYPGPLVDGHRRSGTKHRLPGMSTGFDADWDSYTNPKPEVPQEETAQELINIAELEVNDCPTPATEALRNPNDHRISDTRSRPRVLMKEHPPVLQSLDRKFQNSMRVLVLGYEILEEDGSPVLLVERVTTDRPLNPAQHPDLACWDSVNVEICGFVKDHDTEFLKVARIDGRGNFFLNRLLKNPSFATISRLYY